MLINAASIRTQQGAFLFFLCVLWSILDHHHHLAVWVYDSPDHHYCRTINNGKWWFCRSTDRRAKKINHLPLTPPPLPSLFCPAFNVWCIDWAAICNCNRLAAWLWRLSLRCYVNIVLAMQQIQLYFCMIDDRETDSHIESRFCRSNLHSWSLTSRRINVGVTVVYYIVCDVGYIVMLIWRMVIYSTYPFHQGLKVGPLKLNGKPPNPPNGKNGKLAPGWWSTWVSSMGSPPIGPLTKSMSNGSLSSPSAVPLDNSLSVWPEGFFGEAPGWTFRKKKSASESKSKSPECQLEAKVPIPPLPRCSTSPEPLWRSRFW